jgi:hypothetical protein
MRICQFPEFAPFHFIAFAGMCGWGTENPTSDKTRLFLRLKGVSLKEF